MNWEKKCLTNRYIVGSKKRRTISNVIGISEKKLLEKRKMQIREFKDMLQIIERYQCTNAVNVCTYESRHAFVDHLSMFISRLSDDA